MQISTLEQNVDLITDGERRIYLIGTAHVSRASVELAERIIREVQPQSVAIELCSSRLQSLRDPEAWKNTDIVSVIRSGRSYLLLAQLVLAGFQRKLGRQLDVRPGAEMLRAADVADELGATLVLADRDIRTTLKRTWHSLGLWSTCKLFLSSLLSSFSSEEVDAREVERLKSSDALAELMKEFSESLPEVRRSLIDERDQYLAAKVWSAPGDTIVAVVGAGHVPGMKQCFGKTIDLAELEKTPPRSKVWRVLAWLIPIAVLLMLGYAFLSAGAGTGFRMVQTWVVVNAIAGAIGAALAFAHPLSVLSAALSAPLASLNPFLRAGWIAGFVEAVVRKPRVADFEQVIDDATSLRGFWRNRVTRVLLVVALTNICARIGALVGIERISTFIR